MYVQMLIILFVVNLKHWQWNKIFSFCEFLTFLLLYGINVMYGVIIIIFISIDHIGNHLSMFFWEYFFFWGFEESTFKFLVDRKSEPEIDFITSISNILFYLIEKVLHLGLDQPCTATAKSMLAKNEARHFFKDLLVLMKVCIQYTRNNIQKIRSAYMKCGNKKMFHFDLRHHTIVILKTSVTICKEEKKLDNQMSNNIKISISYSYTFFSYIKWKAVNYVIFLTLMG